MTLKIEGMTCSHCQMNVKKALEAVEGVREAQVDLASGHARIEGSADPARLVVAVEAAGYRAVPQA